MVNGIWTIHLCGLNKGFLLKFYVSFWVQLETTEEGWMMRWLKHCEYNNEDEDKSKLS